ncbi:MAG: methyltransferase domain-containing protein [Candidatus Magasanikbacteria bacterium]|nr:methyltransferase domain-containing protein [Candidatus Magasanikbacteria bacterium]
MYLDKAKKIMKKVESDYDVVAKEWDLSRFVARANQIIIASRIKNGNRVLDVGCGNGVFYPVLVDKSINYVGLDVSKKLLSLAEKKARKIKSRAKVKFIKGSITKLPFVNNQFDWVCAFAVLHHVPSSELRAQAVQEIWRVLKPGGRVVVTVWNMFSDFAEKKFNTGEQLKNKSKGFDDCDVTIPWKGTVGKVVQRYLHAFTKNELSELFKSTGFKKITTYYAIKETGMKSLNIKKGSDLVLLAQK